MAISDVLRRLALNNANTAADNSADVQLGEYGTTAFNTPTQGLVRPQATLPSGGNSDLSELGFDLPTLKAGGNFLGGIGNLAQGWAALKGIKLAQQSFDLEKEFANKNYEAARTTINNRITDQNNFKSVGKKAGGYQLADLVV